MGVGYVVFTWSSGRFPYHRRHSALISSHGSHYPEGNTVKNSLGGRSSGGMAARYLTSTKSRCSSSKESSR